MQRHKASEVTPFSLPAKDIFRDAINSIIQGHFTWDQKSWYKDIKDLSPQDYPLLPTVPKSRSKTFEAYGS